MMTVPSIGVDFGEAWVSNICDLLEGSAGALGELDRLSGDGDFGENISSAMRLVHENIADADPTTYPEWLTAVQLAFLGVGGTSGPLLGMFFRELARCTVRDQPTLGEFVEGLAAGVGTIRRYGGAEVGHKTMVDGFAPAADAMKGALDTESDPRLVVRAGADAAREGARSTADLIAKRGRASYVGEVSRGVMDPGAVAAALIVEAAAAAVGSPRSREYGGGLLD